MVKATNTSLAFALGTALAGLGHGALHDIAPLDVGRQIEIE